MDSPDSRTYMKRDVDDNSDIKSERVADDEEWEGSDKRKHRSSRPKKPSTVDESEGLDITGRRRSSGDRNESRKRSGGSSRGDSDEEDHDARKDIRSKQSKKKQEESSLEKLSSWYQDGEMENRQVGDRSGSRGHIRGDESERRRMSFKVFEHESSRGGSKSKEERSHDGDLEKSLDKESRHSERRESGREKGHYSSESGRTSRRRWDETDPTKKDEENDFERADTRNGKPPDSRSEIAREKSSSSKNEASDSKNRGSDSNGEKGIKSSNREERRLDAEKSKSKGRPDVIEEDNRASPITHEDRSAKEKNEKHRQLRTPGSREKSSNPDEDGNDIVKDKMTREVGESHRSRTPDERTGRRHQVSDHSEMDNERSIDSKRKEQENDGRRDDRSKGRDDSWSDRNRDREGSKDSWKRRQLSNDKDSKDGDILYDRGREWDFPRHGRDRNENERLHSRSGNRKDGNRGEAVKTSSNFGISNENYDVIEIQTKPLNYGRAEPGPNFSRRAESDQQSDVKSGLNEEDWAYTREDKTRRTEMYGSVASAEDARDKLDDVTSKQDQNSWRDEFDNQGGKPRGQRSDTPARNPSGQNYSGSSLPPYGNQEPGSFGRAPLQGVKGNRGGRFGKGRPTGRDNQQVGVPMPIMGSPFGPLGMAPPGAMQPLTPGMSPTPGPPIPAGVFIPPFSPPVAWPGARGVDVNMMGVPPGLSPIPSGPSGPRFPSNMGTPPNHGMYFNQSGLGRGGPSGISGPNFNGLGPMGRGTSSDKNPGGWVPPRISGPPGKAPSRGEQNDYSQNFVDTGMRPQNFIRELELTNVEDYPKLRELIQKKDEIVSNSSSPPMYLKSDLHEFELSPDFFGTKFDVILVDPPWEEYVHRAPGAADHMEYWAFDEILNLKIEAIADTPSFIFLWVGDGVGLEQGRQCLKKWGFRRCEDICWVKTNKANAMPGLRHDSHTLFQHSKEHCLMGIKGTVRRSTDGHIIHANIDTDVIIADEPPYGSTQKPEDMYRIIEHFALGRRRLELFGEDHNIRAGWLTVGKGLSSSNFNSEAYVRSFADKDGKVWQGGGGRNPPPEAPHLVLTTPDIESLRPKSPMKNQQQMQQQQQSSVISLTNYNASNRRPTGNSPQNPTVLGLNQEASNSTPSTPAPWTSDGFRGPPPQGGHIPPEDMYGFNGPPSNNGEFLDFESHR